MRIVEVGPRDGLQNETAKVPTAAKIAFVDTLSQSGVAEIEVSAFVSPRWVPQLSDAREVFRGITRYNGVLYSALVPNRKGLDRAFAAEVDKVSVFTAASETFNQKKHQHLHCRRPAAIPPDNGRCRRSRTARPGVCLHGLLVCL